MIHHKALRESKSIITLLQQALDPVLICGLLLLSKVAYGQAWQTPQALVTASLAGLPAISVPAGLDKDGLPLGLQVIAKTLDENTMFRAAGILEEAAQFVAAPQPWWS